MKPASPCHPTFDGHDLEVGDCSRSSRPAPRNCIGSAWSSPSGEGTVKMNKNRGRQRHRWDVIGDQGSLDLRDPGLQTGIVPPGDLDEWKTRLDTAVRNQLTAHTTGDLWGQVFGGDIVFAGTATLSYSEIPDTVMLLDVQLLLDTDMHALMLGNLKLFDGVVQVPAALYGDLSKVGDGSARLLFLADVGQVDLLLDDPLVTLRGEASFDTIKDNTGKVIGFEIDLEGGVDLNIPMATTITLEGETTLAFLSPSTGPELQIDLGFDAALSETNIGNIADAIGNFHLSIDKDVPVDAAHPLGGTEIWGAALLTTDFDFLKDVGLYATASAVLRVNSSDTDKDEVLQGDTSPPASRSRCSSMAPPTHRLNGNRLRPE